MKISFIGPGFMPIPPKGWGAVESLIWDYKIALEKKGVEVQIVNTPNFEQIHKEINAFQPDVVHLQYEDYVAVLREIASPIKVLTSHFAYIEQTEKYMSVNIDRFRLFVGRLKSFLRGRKHLGGYREIMGECIKGDFYIFCLSQGIKDTYIKLGVSEARLRIAPNGARSDLFHFTENPTKADRSIYLAKITARKRQYLYQSIDSIDFAGNKDDDRFDFTRSNYLGEWSKETLYRELTNYANLVLLSDGEADPLVTKEALMAGLGLVISEQSTANLDLSLDFIDVIKDDKINDVEYVKQVVQNNREKSVKRRNEIRQYALQNFSWDVVVEWYLSELRLLSATTKSSC